MARRFGFKPPLRQTMLANAAHIANLAGGELPADLAASMARTLPAEPRKRVGAVKNTAEHPESDVLNDVAEMLHAHPLVICAIRQNSGSASYEAKSGRWAPVKFYDWIKRPEKMRVVDVWGLLNDNRRFYAFETKHGAWHGPGNTNSDTHVREREQAAFLAMVRMVGGVGEFVRSVEEARAALK